LQKIRDDHLQTKRICNALETEREELLHQITNWKKETEALSLELEYSKKSLKMAERTKRDRKIIYQRQKEELISENEVNINFFKKRQNIFFTQFWKRKFYYSDHQKTSKDHVHFGFSGLDTKIVLTKLKNKFLHFVCFSPKIVFLVIHR
jgi:hypothetical protein